MTTILDEILGSYVPLTGEGLASINFDWIAGAIIFIMLFWFVLRLILNLLGHGGDRRG